MKHLKSIDTYRFTQAIIQILLLLGGIIGGVLGLGGVYLSVKSIFDSSLEKIFLGLIVFLPLSIGFGSYLISLAYLAMKKFSAQVVFHFCIILSLLFWGALNVLLRYYFEVVKHKNFEFGILSISVFGAFLLFWWSRKMLINWTGVDQQEVTEEVPPYENI